jgi:hypothetical protein
MPLTLPQYGSGDSRGALGDFVRGVHLFLDELVQGNRDPAERPIFVENLLTLMRGAWQEGRGVFESIESGIRNADPARVREHGLEGQQLRFKLGVLRYLNDRYQTIGKGVLRRLLDAIDTLLKSIISVLGGGEAAEELKDYIKDSIDD